MKKVFILLVFLPVMISCDTVSGISVNYKYENTAISINQIYLTLKDNLEYSEIKLIDVPQKESFNLFPKFGKTLIKPYEYISIYFDNFFIIVEYINSDREYAKPDDNYLHIYSKKFGGTDQETMDLKKIKIDEIVDILIREYPEYFNKNKFVYEHGK